MKIILKSLFLFLFLVLLTTSAYSFTPTSDINGRAIYSIFNFTDINSTRMYDSGSRVCTADNLLCTAAGTRWDITASSWLYNTSLTTLEWNETKGNATYLLVSNEANLDVNSSNSTTFWASVSSFDTTWFDDLLNVLTWNSSKADSRYILTGNESNLNVNSSDYWDSLNTPSDINAGDITDDGTYVKTVGDTMTGNLSLGNNSINDVLRMVYNITGCTEDTIEGTLCWNPDDFTLNIVTGLGNTIQVGQEITSIAKNGDSVALLNGQVVALIGSSGDRGIVRRADASNIDLASKLAVVTIDSCAVNADCPVTTFGRVRGLDTTAWAANTTLYLSADGSGNLTSTVPDFPNYKVSIAAVIRSHANDGIILVGPRLDYTDGVTLNSLGIINNLNVTGTIYGASDWINNQNYPAACVAGSAVTEINDTITCSTFVSSVSSGNGMDFSTITNTGSVTMGTPGTLSDSTTNGVTTTSHTHDISDVYVLNSGDTMTGALNMSNNPIYVDGITLKPLDQKNALISGPAYGIYQTGPSGQNLPHLIIQSGGSTQASVVLRSLMIVDEIAGFHNTTNATDCYAYMTEIGEILKIDCNTTTTGADLLVGDDMQVVGDVWIKNTLGEWRFMTRSLTIQDELNDNLLLGRSNVSLSGTTFTIEDSHAENIIVNINRNETILSSSTDSVTITAGTNETPVMNFVTYQDEASPTLTRSGSVPSVEFANVARVLLGAEDNIYASIGGRSAVDEFISQSYVRWFNQGVLYSSGFFPVVDATNISIASGTATVLLDQHSDTSVGSLSANGTFVVLSNGSYVQFTDIEDITQYADGGTISTNKYYNLVCGVIHSDVNGHRMMCIVQNEPSSEYITVSGAEVDTYDALNIFPNDAFLKNLFLPVARMIVQKVAGTDEFQVLSSGERFFDVRGSVGATGGAPPSPSITDHALLSNLDYFNSGHTGFVNTTQLDAVNATALAKASPGDCSPGEFVQNTTISGVECATPAGGGTVTSVGSGNGLTGGPITGSGTLSIDALTAGLGNYSYWDGDSWETREDTGSMNWADPVDADIIPDTDDTYDIGNSTVYFLSSYITNLYTNLIYGKGDSDTVINFTTDKIIFDAGGKELLTLTEGATTEVVVNDGSNDVDFRIESDISSNAFVFDGAGSGIVINEDGSSVADFRVESNTDTHVIYVDSGENAVGIGTATPSGKLEVVGDINVTGAANCIYLPSGGSLCGNSSCITLTSPDGGTEVNSCN